MFNADRMREEFERSFANSYQSCQMEMGRQSDDG